MKVYIKAMSTDRKTLHYNLFNASKPLTMHLIKLIEFPNAQAKNHWVKEVYAFLSDVPTLKSSKKLPSARFIYTEISCYNDVLGNMIFLAEDSEPDEQFADVPAVTCLPIVESYQKWLAEQLSTKGYVLLQEVKDELQNLGLL